MRNLQLIPYNLHSEQGFTLMEMMVVITIMALLATVLVLNLGGQRAKRDVQIAENQLVSDIRQYQSASLSSRLLPSGQTIQYYILKFNLSQPGQYAIEAAYNTSSSPQLAEIQTILLPPDVLISTIGSGGPPLSIFRQTDPAVLSLPGSYGNCGLLAFAAPFGKVLMDSNCSIAGFPNIISGDDYFYLINFQNNLACQASNNPAGCNVSADSSMSITLTNTDRTYSKTVTVSGITGAVSFN